MSGERRCLRSILGDSNIRFGDETVLKDTSTNAVGIDRKKMQIF